MLEDMEKSLGFTKPIVGIHVRRTDKVGTEAAFHPVEEYMKYVSFIDASNNLLLFWKQWLLPMIAKCNR